MCVCIYICLLNQQVNDADDEATELETTLQTNYNKPIPCTYIHTYLQVGVFIDECL